MAETKRTVELPGFVDLQVNGFVGVDFTDRALTTDGVLKAVAAIEKTGVTRFLPTLITCSLETFAASARTVVRTTHPAIVGSTWRGRTSRRGRPARSAPAGVRPGRERRRLPAPAGRGGRADRDRHRRAGGSRAVPLIEYLVANKVRAAIGHSNANGAQIQDAVKAGATMSTHLGNGCANMLPRHPNVIWEQLGRTACWPGSSSTATTCRGHGQVHDPAKTPRGRSW